jgi:hypothetical protein
MRIRNGMIFFEPAGRRMYMLASLLKRLALLPRSFKLTCARSGNSATSGALRFVYIGDGESLPYFEELLGAGRFELSSEKAPIWRIRKMIRQMSATGACVCAEINRLLLPIIPDNGILTFPWLRQRVCVDSEEYRARRRKIEDNFGRKVRKYRYDFRQVQDAGLLEHFYRCLYLPHIAARFGNAGHARGLTELKNAVKKGFLVQVLRDGRWVAGAVCSLRNNELSAKAFGHLPEEEYSLRLGGLSAAYYYLFEYAAKHSLTRIDLLRTRPNSRDGVYRHKHRWGAIAEKDPWPHAAIRLYSPQGIPPPQPLESLLVWDGGEFSELKQKLSRGRERT